MKTLIETGQRWVRLDTLNKIANSLQVSVADLFKGINPENACQSQPQKFGPYRAEGRFARIKKDYPPV
jgi:hypothetical protein